MGAIAMPGLRISIAGLLGIVAVLAIWLAGMRSASSLWTTTAATVTLALLLTALLAAVLFDGTDRTFWAGFALFAWSYLLLVNWDWVGGPFGHDLTAGLSDLADTIFPEVPIVGAPRTGPGAPSSSPIISPAQSIALARAQQIRLGNFVQIGRMLLSLGFGLLGGSIARGLAERRRPPTPQAAGQG
jgi:hypothetical protein